MDKAKCVLLFDSPQALVQRLKSAAPPGVEVVTVSPATTGRRPGQARHPGAEALKDADVIMTLDDIPAGLLKQCASLKFVQLLSGGYDRAELPAALEAGVRIAGNGGADAAPAAEHTVLLMLALLHRIRFQYENVKARAFDEGFHGQGAADMVGKTVGIIGLGAVGRQVARILRGWEATAVYHDIQKASAAVERELKVRRVSLEELLARSDIVTLHVPHTARTHHMIGERELAMMKPSAILINTSRGGVVDDAALTRALKARSIAGAGLDVFEEEPPKDPAGPFFYLDNALTTPHTAFASAEAMDRAAAFAMQNVQRVMRGQSPQGLARPEE